MTEYAIDLDAVDLTPASPVTGAPLTGPDAPSTDKQHAFIKDLIASRALTPEVAAQVEQARGWWREGTLNRQTASHLIDSLKECPRKTLADSGTSETVEPAGVGIYVRDGVLIKVQESRESGALYAKVWEDGQGWTYAGRKPLYGLTAQHAITPAEAKQFGDTEGQCVSCGRSLTDERSISVGYGPVCADRHGWPWGEAVDDTAAAAAVLQRTPCAGCEESDGEPHEHVSDAGQTV